MAPDLTGRSALVTGAAGGFGRAITKALLQAGARVTASDVAEGGLAALEAELADAGLAQGAAFHRLDIADFEACAAAVAAAQERFGALDILVNNGALGMGAIRDDHMTDLVGIDEITPETWARFVAVNFSGPWNMTKAAVPGMKRAGWGRIVTITTSFFTMLRGRFHPYGPTKAGLEAMTAGHAKEFAADGITVNIVVPGGPSDTAMVPEVSGYDRAALIPVAKMLPPLLWLCSAEADGVTGKRYVAALWDESVPVAEARAASQATIAWPELAESPVWPGGKPKA